MITSSIRAGSRSLRVTRALSTSAARSAGCQPESFPLRLPPAVLTASMITALAIACLLPRRWSAGQSLACAAVKNMDRWLGDGGMPIIAAIGGSFDGYGGADERQFGWASA